MPIFLKKVLADVSGADFSALEKHRNSLPGAGVAQLVEHHLAKVTVVSSSLITRSIFLFP